MRPVGSTGAIGPQGPPGPPGEKGKGLSGVKYVRWGKTKCSGDATTVYSGIMGGEHYTHSGGAANYLCLPKVPKYDRYKDGAQHGGLMYGTEYELSFNPFDKTLQDHNAACAVCYVESRGSMLMMPARNDCPSGWTEEYHGYLMTEHYTHKSQKEFVCIDRNAEYVPGTQANTNGALLYFVEGMCGSHLPCGPYVSGRELTCAVCTK
ncbi:uncharacterized protein [Porites lutea]|uniref:uncharacterized protein n=1 Tax=Porites lutea TaxID=51062 RepID=UPI003CC592D3